MAGFNTPVEDRYFEDYVPGAVHEFGRITINEESIVLPLGNRSTLSFFTPTPRAPSQPYTTVSSTPSVFIVGFSLVFVALGASLGLLGAVVPQEVLEKVGGALLITFGIFLGAATKVPWLNYEKRLNFGKARGAGYLRSLLIGVVFSLGWIPCVGPILGGILTLAASSQTVWQGVYLLLGYCVGLGLPFIAVGLALGAASRYIRWLSRHAFVTSIVAAVLLIGVGVLMLTGYLEYLSGLMPGGY